MKIQVVRALGSLLLLALSTAALAASQLLIPVTPSTPGPLAKSGAGAPVRFNSGELFQLQPGAEVELALPDGSRHTYVYEQSISHGGGFNTWIARSILTGDNERAIVTHGPAGAWGWMRTGYGDYRIFPSGLGYDLLAPRPPRSYAPTFPGGDAIPAGPDAPETAPLKGIPTMLAPHAAMKSFGMPKLAPVPSVQADVMVIYTKDLADKLGVGVLPMIYNLVASANQAYVDSEVALSLRLVNATMLDYSNANESGDTLDYMRGTGPQSAAFQALTWGAGSALRNVVGADFVALVRDGPDDTGGIAFLLKNPAIYPDPTPPGQTIAYSVNNFCATGCEQIFAHELGHNMGNHHDRATVGRDTNGAMDDQGVFAYSFGHYSCSAGLTCNPFVAGGCASDYASCSGDDDNDFGTIMSYFSPRVMKFSNASPSVTCVPAGGIAAAARPCGGATVLPAPAGTSNNALSMNNVRGSVSAYRTQTIASLPGSLQFTTSAYSAPESGATLTFTVSRASGTSGAVSVSYLVTGASATVGPDFTAASGTLTWGNGDGANKTFTVTLANDMVTEGVETLTATLSSPSGPPGVYLGYPTQAVGLILEPWPVGTLGALPAGFSTPPAASVPWSIVNESNDADGRSLKSGAINFSVDGCNHPEPQYAVFNPVPCPSVMEYSGTFPAGLVAYSYRVSAYPGFGFLEFLVDGVVVQRAGGSSANTSADTGWLYFSTHITAGPHTLQWRYRPIFSFPCANASVGGNPPLYPSCADRAWIDQLSLPQVAPACTAGDDDNDGIPNCAELAEGRNPFAKDNDIFANARLFAMQQYRDFLNREGDAGGIAFWTNQIATAAQTRGQGVESFFNSAEFQSTVSPVARLYFAYFLRIPDYDGLQFWINYYKTGHSLDEISNFFAASPEFAARYGALTNSQYVTLVYQNVLERAPDSGGLAFWTNQLDTGARTRGQVMLGFSESPEYQATSLRKVYVTMMYVGMLRRAPDQGGFDFWVGYLNSGNSGLALIGGFLAAPEYRNRFLP